MSGKTANIEKTAETCWASLTEGARDAVQAIETKNRKYPRTK